jgi:penicillin-binding protein 2
MKTSLKIPRRNEHVKQGDPAKQPLDQLRFVPFYIVLVVAIAGLTSRLFYLQILRGKEYEEAAKENRISFVNIPAPRGVIYDRNGVQLVKNIPEFNVTLTPAYLPSDTIRLQELYQYISQLTGVPVRTPPLEAGAAGGDTQPPRGITELVAEGESLAPYNPVIIKRNVSSEVALMLRGRQRTLPGVGISVTPQREYTTGPLTSHLVGYMGPITKEVADDYIKLGFDPSRDKIGYAGVEAWEQDTLGGKNGSKTIEEDVAGLELRTIGDVVNPVPGNNLSLTIDVRLQASTQAALQRGITLLNLQVQRTVSQIGVAIAMNPVTGEILSMVSIPTYDNQKFARFIPADYYTDLLKDPTNPLFNQAISGQHAPGSVFKIVTAAAALQKGTIDPNRKLFDPGQIVIENKYFPNDPGKARTVVCWKRDGHGDIDMITAIAQSCSVYFYKIGGGYAPEKVTGIDIEGIYEYGNYFGFNRRTTIELPGERKGLIPNRDYKRLNIGENWSTGDTYIASIGQGYVLSTPIQVLNSVTPFLNNGFLIKPTLIKDVIDGEGNIVKPFQTQYLDAIPATPELDPVPISANTINIVRRGMEKVIVDGTGEDLDRIDGVQYAGKSGTAEYCDNVAQKKDLCKFGAWPEHAWFLAYAPADKPEIAVVVFVYNGGEGSKTAGPIAQQILQAYFELKKTDASRK